MVKLRLRAKERFRVEVLLNGKDLGASRLLHGE